MLEAKVADLQSGLIAVNRTVQDFLLEHSSRISRSQEQREEALNRAIDVQKVEIERLKTERKDLLKRIYELSSLLKEQEKTKAIEAEADQGERTADASESRKAPSTANTQEKHAVPVSDIKRSRPLKKTNSARYWLMGSAAAVLVCVAAMVYQPWREKIIHIILTSVPF